MPIFSLLSSSSVSLFTSSSLQSSSNFSHLLPLFFSLVFIVFDSDREQQQEEITVLRVSSGLKRVKFRPGMTSFMRSMFSTERPSISYSGLWTSWLFNVERLHRVHIE
ncbi:uncharacterized protein LOC113766753 [Coffea eugenioides]|uniref:uncharacterized protein LOC113766753 n=1 Tax=Coffea eugenioides TaxID=49369 RepID=UPI000F614BEC|nr:uncharacterized protein LOC113766753 [Coffea eugenioides]